MKYIVTAAIDSWHLANGVHCPNCFLSSIWRECSSIEECLTTVKEYGERIGYRMKMPKATESLVYEFEANNKEGLIMIVELSN